MSLFHHSEDTVKAILENDGEFLKIISKFVSTESRLVEIINRLLPHQHDPHSQIAHSGIVSQLKFNNTTVKGKIMSVTFSKTQKVTATITGLNAAGKAVAAGSITNLTATFATPGIVSLGNIDPTAQTIDIIGVADGATDVTYSFTNTAGNVISFTDTITIFDAPAEDNVAVTGQVSYSAPVAQ